MAVIDIGSGAINRDSASINPYTHIDRGNAANATGKINVFKFFGYDVGNGTTGLKMGTFFGAATTFEGRDYETLGNFNDDSLSTFSGLDCAVESGDFVGAYWAEGRVDAVPSGGSGYPAKLGDQFGQGEQTYPGGDPDGIISLYGEGAVIDPTILWRIRIGGKTYGVTLTEI